MGMTGLTLGPQQQLSGSHSSRVVAAFPQALRLSPGTAHSAKKTCIKECEWIWDLCDTMLTHSCQVLQWLPIKWSVLSSLTLLYSEGMSVIPYSAWQQWHRLRDIRWLIGVNINIINSNEIYSFAYLIVVRMCSQYIHTQILIHISRSRASLLE